jgi:hypothetical protein
MSPGDMKLEIWLAMFQKLVETQVDQNRSPPIDLAQHIEYYKDSFQMIHRIALTESDSSPSLESSHLADVRSVAAPARSAVGAGPGRPGAADLSPLASLRRQSASGGGGSAVSASTLENPNSSDPHHLHSLLTHQARQ